MAQKETMFIEFTDKGTVRTHTRNVRGSEKATQSLRITTTGLRREIGALRNNILLTTFAIGAIAKVTTELTGQFQRLERSTFALEGLTGSAELAADFVAQIGDATKGTISQLDATAAAARFAAMGLASTAKEAAQLAKVAVTLGAAFDKNATESIEEFTLLLANQSILRLDTFGISGARVRERIKELQKETKGLSRETAFLNAVMEESDIKLGQLEGVLETSGAEMDRLKASSSNLAAALGERLNPLVSAMATAFTQAAVALTDIITTADEAAPSVDELRGQWVRAQMELARFTEQEIEFTKTGRAAKQLVDDLGLALFDLQNPTVSAIVVTDDLGESAKSAAINFRELASSISFALSALEVLTGNSSFGRKAATIIGGAIGFAGGGGVAGGVAGAAIGGQAAGLLGLSRARITPDASRSIGGNVTNINLNGVLISEDAIRNELLPAIARAQA